MFLIYRLDRAHNILNGYECFTNSARNSCSLMNLTEHCQPLICCSSNMCWLSCQSQTTCIRMKLPTSKTMHRILGTSYPPLCHRFQIYRTCKSKSISSARLQLKNIESKRLICILVLLKLAVGFGNLGKGTGYLSNWVYE